MHLRSLFPLALLTFGACGDHAEHSADFPRPTNLLVIAVDTLRADALGAYGGEDDCSPNLDRLGEQGVIFDNAVSHASWTLPSFASTLTSTYTSTHGCWTFETRLADGLETLPEVFQAAGFDTFGIASHIFFNEKYGLQQGFDEFDDSLGHKAGEKGWEPLTSPQVSERAVHWIDGRASNESPWLLWLHYFDPHAPYQDHSQLNGGAAVEDERERYQAEVRYTDKYVGEVLAALERNGFAENTCVLFFSDHGEAFHEHDGVRRHSRSLFTEELRVPLMLKVPGLAPKRIRGMTRTVDLMPTLLDLFSLDATPGQMIGSSLMPSLIGAEQTSAPLLAEIGLRALPEGKHKRAVLDDRWKLIEGLDGTFQLFDYRADPLERTDQASAQPKEVQRLKALMQQLQREAREHAARFESGGLLEHTPEQLQHLKDLGYVGDED